MKSNETNTSRFLKEIDSRAQLAKSRIVLALDIDYAENDQDIFTSATKILESTARYICAVKLNFHVILPLSLSELRSLNEKISSYGLCSIADIKLNDIDNTNRVATEYLWKAGFSAVIVNPFVGYEGGLDVVFKRARELGKGVITLAYMSHKGAVEGYGLKLDNGKSVFELFLERANEWGSDGVILGTTRPEYIEQAKRKLFPNVRIFSPGSGAQGGDVEKSLMAGSDYLIIGRSIVSAKNPDSAVKQIHASLVHLTEKP